MRAFVLASALLATATLAARAFVASRQFQSLTPTTSRKLNVFDNFRDFNRRFAGPVRRPKIFGRLCEDQPRSKRTYSGYCNNLLNPEWGATHEKFVRVSTPLIVNLATRPNARRISNIVCRTYNQKPNRRGMSEFTTFFGQFLDHTITQTENTKEAMPITIPADDPVFKNGGTLPFFRTKKRGFGAMQAPLNRLSSYIDAASVYGADEKDARQLRLLRGGRMRMSAGNLLPKNSHGFFLAGDSRANENPILTSMHTLWTREHNRVADEVAKAYPLYSDEEVYSLARQIVGAEMQAVVYYEFLPAVMDRYLPKYTGYKSWVKAHVTDEFSAVGFRVGHTLVNAHVKAVDARGRVVRRRLLRHSFFKPRHFEQDGVDGLLRATLRHRAGEVDNEITDEVRNFLIEDDATRTVQLDLAALNIQRGRDHAIPHYNQLRAAYGLPPVFGFGGITKDAAVQAKLRAAYGSVDNVDPWVAGISEDHRSGSLGETFAAIWADQFKRLRDGDRFYFERPGLFPSEQIERVETLRELLGTRRTAIGNVMRNIILRNTGIKENELKDSPFFV